MSASNGQLLASASSGALLHRASDGALIYDAGPAEPYDVYDGHLWHATDPQGTIYIMPDPPYAVRYTSRNYDTSGSVIKPFDSIQPWDPFRKGYPGSASYKGSLYSCKSREIRPAYSDTVYDIQHVYMSVASFKIPHSDNGNLPILIQLDNPVFSDVSSASLFRLCWRLTDGTSASFPSQSELFSLPSAEVVNFSSQSIISSPIAPIRLFELFLRPADFSHPTTVTSSSDSRVTYKDTCSIASMHCRLTVQP